MQSLVQKVGITIEYPPNPLKMRAFKDDELIIVGSAKEQGMCEIVCSVAQAIDGGKEALISPV